MVERLYVELASKGIELNKSHRNINNKIKNMEANNRTKQRFHKKNFLQEEEN